VKPPMPMTASALEALRMALQRRIDCQVFHKKGSIRTERVGGLATAGRVSNSRWPYLAEASASTFFWEMRSLTLWPLLNSASATAMPGNKCPPVPPQAMRILRDLVGVLDTRAQSRIARFARKNDASGSKRCFYASPNYQAMLKRLLDCFSRALHPVKAEFLPKLL